MLHSRQQKAFTLVELLLVLAVGSMVLLGLQRALSMGAQVTESVREGVELDHAGRYAFERMVQAVRHTSALLIPTADDPGTDWFENVRAQSVPAAAPTGSSLLDTAVLAVALPAYLDTNTDGFADADNDRDGRINEDLPADATNDGESGIALIDDDGDGQIDEEVGIDSDDETASVDDDPVNGADDDGDGRRDEDPSADMNGDGFPGRAGADDDDDGSVDEGAATDDDEDGVSDEDWLDTQIFMLQGDALVERRSVPWDENGDGSVNGEDFVESILATGVTQLGFERLVPQMGAAPLVVVTLKMSDDTGRQLSLSTRVQIGGGLGGAL